MSLVINSQFRPFTYDDMVKPLVQYKEAYDKVEQDYSTLSAQTEALKDIAERSRNPIAYEKHSRYLNDLNEVIKDFSKGMNISNRKALLDLKRRYYEDIEPIARASKKIEELSTEQRKLAASNPNLMFDRDFSSDVSIDQMMENPNLSYKTINGNDIYAKGAAIAKTLSSRINSISPTLQGQYWEIRKGYGEDEANRFLLNSGAIPELNKALEDLVDTVDAPDKLKDRVFEYARQGAISGMESNVSYQANRDYRDALEKEALETQMGKRPYITDSDGTKYYMNKAAGVLWSVDKNGVVKFNKTGDDGGSVEDNLEPDTALGNGIYKDPKKPSNKYKKGADGKFHRLSTEELATLNKNGIARINSYKSNNNKPKPDEVIMFSVDGDGNLTKITREENLKEYEQMYSDINRMKVKSISEYLGGDLNSDAAKTIKAEIASTPLTLEDIEVVSNAGNKPYFSDERILIRTKSTNSDSSGREQTHSM